MARLTYTHTMTGVRPQRSEILNARPWAIVKLVGFIIACFTVGGLLLLSGAMLAGAKINFHAPAVVVPAPVAPAPSIPAPAAATPPVAPVPPIMAQIVPAPAPPAPTAPAPDSPEELERAYKEKLLAEGENP